VRAVFSENQVRFARAEQLRYALAGASEPQKYEETR